MRCAPSPTSSRPTCSRPRSSSATSSTTTRTACSRSREMVELGAARGDHDPARTAASPASLGGRPTPRAATRVRVEPRRARRDGRRRATRSWPATSRRATTAPPPRTACAYGVACGAESTQHLGAGVIDPRRSSGSLARGRGRAPREPAGSPDRAGRAVPSWPRLAPESRESLPSCPAAAGLRPRRAGFFVRPRPGCA